MRGSSLGGDATCPLTTIMDSLADLINVVQSPPQEQAQSNPPPDDPLTAPPTIPEHTETQRPPPAGDIDDIDARTLEKERKEQLRALGFAYLLLDLSSLANARFSLPARHLGIYLVSRSLLNGTRGKCIVISISTTQYHEITTARLVAILRSTDQSWLVYVEIAGMALFLSSWLAYTTTTKMGVISCMDISL